MKKITFTTAILASACAFGGFEGHVSADGYVPGLQQGIFRNGGRANVNFSATCAEADRFSHTLGTILADANQSDRCQVRNELTGTIEKWELEAAILYEGEMYFEGGREYSFFGCVDNLSACELDGACFFCEGDCQTEKLGIMVVSKTFKESGWHPIRVWLADAGGACGAWSGRVGFQMGIGWNTNGCKVVNSTTQLQWNPLLDDGSGRLLRSKVLPQKDVKHGMCGPVGTKDGEVRTFGAQDGLPFEIEMAWVAGRGEVDGFWVSKNRVTQRQWKEVMGYNPVDKDKQDDDAPVSQLGMAYGFDVVEFLWCLNARYAGVGRFARLSDAQWQLAAKYCTVGLPLEFSYSSLRIAFSPSDKRNNELEAQKLVKRGSDIAFEAKLAKGEAKRYSLADGLDLDMIKVEGCGDTFCLGRYEVTQEQYEKVMASNPSNCSGADNLPVTCATWTNAMTFCEKLNALVPVEGMTWTLPSAKQWAFAANGGLKKLTASFFGGDKWQEVGWWGGDEYGHWYVRPVGLKKPNELGFHDLFGNCWEWCCDGDGRADCRYLAGPGIGHGSGKCLIESHRIYRVTDSYGDFGFRVALVPTAQQVFTVTDTEGKETVDGYTWSYRVKNGEAEIYAVSPSPTGHLSIPSTFTNMKVTSIGQNVFSNCNEVTSVTIPEGVARIGLDAFKRCHGLTSVMLPESMTNIGVGAFCECDGLKAIKIPSRVKEIGAWAFYGCNGLASVEIPEGVTSIGLDVFKRCHGLTSVMLPESVTNIGVGAFCECDGLKAIKIPSRVKKIGAWAFYGCKGLKSVEIPEEVTSIGGDAFRGCGDVRRVPGTLESRAEKTAVAGKLNQCDFLLNKDFKKNAKVYLCLFSASWCGPCRAEMPRIAKTYADTLKADPDIELIHFSCDRDDDKAMAWAKEHDVKFPVVKPKGGNPLNLRTRGIPHLFIVKADGTVLEEGHPASLFKEEKLRALKQ